MEMKGYEVIYIFQQISLQAKGETLKLGNGGEEKGPSTLNRLSSDFSFIFTRSL